MKGIQQEETERTEKIDLKAPFFPGEHRVHPLFEKAKILNAQLLSYMKLLNVPLGLLINFHEMKVTDGIRRLILPGANQ
jgi:hypothetical protein